MKSVKPVFQRDSFSSQRIVHREKISKLTTPGTGAFTVLASIAMNPGIAASFPWLSNEAQGWESYRFNRLRYIWVPTSGTAVAGNIIMAPDYDASDAAPAGETFMSSYTDAEEANVWARFASDLEVDLLNGETRRKFVRLGALASNQDIKLYDSGNFFVVSTDDAVANSGKLWVEYDVHFFNPQTPPGGFQAAGTLQNGSGTLTAAAPWGTAPLATGSLVLSATGDVVTISNVQVGQEVFVWYGLLGTTLSDITAAVTGGTAVTARAGANAGATESGVMLTILVTSLPLSVDYASTAATVTAANACACVLAPRPAW